jgi:hypothetical protein
MIMAPSQMLDAHPPRITDFGLPYRDETDVIMAKSRDMKGAAGAGEPKWDRRGARRLPVW